MDHALFFTKDGEEVDFLIEKGQKFIALEAKLTGELGPAALKGFHALRRYYGEDALLKELVICRIKNDFSFSRQVRAINGVNPDF